MKLEVGMYVRTNRGYIDKIKKIFEEGDKVFCTEKEGIHFTELIAKASHNIIDLIEVGDYVNGNEVVYSTLKDGGNIVIYKTGFCANNEEIKSIVTKEQFESMSYKVGE